MKKKIKKRQLSFIFVLLVAQFPDPQMREHQLYFPLFKPSKSTLNQSHHGAVQQLGETTASTPPMNQLFVEMGIDYDQHRNMGQLLFTHLTLLPLVFALINDCPFENFIR